MKNRLLLLLVAGMVTALLTCCHSAGAQGSRHFQSHALQPPPMPPREYSREARFYRFSSRDVVSAFKQNGLEVGDLAPGLTVGAPGAHESTIFLIPSYGKNIGGLVSSFSLEESLQKSVQYYETMNRKKAPPAWRIFIKDNILLLISGKVPEDTARTYENVLSSMKFQ